MALLFLDSFDHYSATEYLQKWTDHYVFASAWTISGVNAAEFGPKLES